MVPGGSALGSVRRSSTSTRRPARPSRCSTPTGHSETFGRCGAGWFWWARQRGYSPAGPATGPFATSYSAFRHAMVYGGTDYRLTRSRRGLLSAAVATAERARFKEFMLRVLPYCFRAEIAWKQMPDRS